MANSNAVELNAEPMRGHHQRALRITQGWATDAIYPSASPLCLTQNREVHVRICERRGVKFLGPIGQQRHIHNVSGVSGSPPTPDICLIVRNGSDGPESDNSPVHSIGATSTMSGIEHFPWTVTPTKSRVEVRSRHCFARQLPQKTATCRSLRFYKLAALMPSAGAQ